MNNAFLTLPSSKQERIINAALEIFAKHEYKKANTEDIAALAGISKGSLFYYFKNKESLFLYLFEYVMNLVSEYIKTDNYLDMTDFFELMDYGAKRKILMINKNPYILDFILQCYFQKDGPAAKHISERMNSIIQSVFSVYLSHIDTSKFKDDVDFKEVYNILLYATEGYIQTSRNSKEMLDINTMMNEFNKWSNLFKKMTYKEEYQ